MKYLLSKISIKTKIISMFTVICFLVAFGIAGYEVSYKKHHINKKNFTISQSLAFGNDTALVTLFTLGILFYIYLLFLRGPAKYLYLRFLFLMIAFIFLIIIIWVTTYKDLHLHRKFAATIFISILIYHILTLIAFKNISKKLFYYLFLVVILNIIVIISSEISLLNNKKQIFAVLENTNILIMFIVILLLGFMN